MRFRRTSGSKSGLFLLEMTLVVFFFALTSAVYVRVFASAQRIGRESKTLTEATLIAQNLAEAWYAAGGELTETAERFALCDAEDELLTLYYDSTWKALPADRLAAASYLAYIRQQPASGEDAGKGELRTAELKVTSVQGDVVYELPLVCYPEAHTKEGER